MDVSVIIPVFNGERFIAEALTSIYQQSVPVSEIICIDDGSTDNTYSLIRSHFPDVNIYRNSRNEGPSYSRNKGIEMAEGDIVGFLDADDCWLPTKNELQLRRLRLDPDLEIIGGLAEYFVMPESSNRKESSLLAKPHFNSYLSSFLVRKSLFEKTGLFNIEMRLSEDQDWVLRVRETNSKIKIVNETVFLKRIHDQNTTKDLPFSKSGMTEALKKSLDRRRDSGNAQNLTTINVGE